MQMQTFTIAVRMRTNREQLSETQGSSLSVLFGYGVTGHGFIARSGRKDVFLLLKHASQKPMSLRGHQQKDNRR